MQKNPKEPTSTDTLNIDAAATWLKIEHPELSTYECYRIAQGNATIAILKSAFVVHDMSGLTPSALEMICLQLGAKWDKGLQGPTVVEVLEEIAANVDTLQENVANLDPNLQ